MDEQEGKSIMTELTDSEVFKKIVARDPKALEVIYNRYSPLLYSIIYKIMEDEKASEVILEDVFMITWNWLPKLPFGLESPYVWLISLAKNKAIDTKKRLADSEYDSFAYDEFYEEMYIIPKVAAARIPLDLQTALLIKNQVEQALNNLTDAQQHVLNLGIYGAMSEQEIAQHLNIPVETVKQKLSLALEILREKINLEF